MTSAVFWWGKHHLALNQRWCWYMGQRAFVIERRESEWIVSNIETAEESNDELKSDDCQHTPFNLINEKQQKKGSVVRYLQANTPDTLTILPYLADRSVIARPSHPLHILPGQQVYLYVSTPLWFTASVADIDVKMLDLPFWRPSDSWFGASKSDGELCYAKYTDARLELSMIERRPHRAITPIKIINRHKDTLMIERLNLPVTLLNLYSDQDGQLWTQSCTITRNANHDAAELDLAKHAPTEATGAKHVVSPRIKSEKPTLIKSLSSLFA